jgi:hypothetical protein
MHGALRLVSSLAFLVMIYGALVVGLSVPDFYMVASGEVRPGEPIYVDELAMTLRQSGSNVALGLGLIFAAAATRWLVRRKLRARSELLE